MSAVGKNNNVADMKPKQSIRICTMYSNHRKKLQTSAPVGGGSSGAINDSRMFTIKTSYSIFRAGSSNDFEIAAFLKGSD